MIVETTAIATIIVNRFWFNTPMERPTVATITSVEPRAFMPHASASDSRRDSRPNLPPMNAPPNLPMLAMRTRSPVSNRRSVFFRMVKSALKYKEIEKCRAEAQPFWLKKAA